MSPEFINQKMKTNEWLIMKKCIRNLKEVISNLFENPTNKHSLYFFLAYLTFVTLMYLFKRFDHHIMCDESMLLFFENPMHQVTETIHGYFYGSILYIWVGHLLNIDTWTKLKILTSAYFFLAAFFLYGATKLNYSDDKSACRFISVVFGSMIFAILGGWLGLTDPFLFILYLAVFFLNRYYQLSFILTLLMVFTHKEQTVFILLSHTILYMFDRNQVKKLCFMWSGAIVGWLAFSAYLTYFDFNIMKSRIDLATNPEYITSGLINNLKELPKAIYAIYGVAWVFFYYVYKNSKKREKLQLFFVTLIPFGVSLLTHDFFRVLCVLSLPSLFYLADMNAKNGYSETMFDTTRYPKRWRRFFWVVSLIKWRH